MEKYCLRRESPSKQSKCSIADAFHEMVRFGIGVIGEVFSGVFDSAVGDVKIQSAVEVKVEEPDAESREWPTG